MRKIALTLIVAGAVLATEASAQVMVRASSVPPGQRPPDGMCRVWIEGVPAGRQPAATDCITARANAPLNSRIIYGSDEPFPGRATGRFRDADGVWHPVGRDRSGNVIYERRVRDRNGRTIVERARSRDGRTLTRIPANGRVDRDRDRDRDRDWDDDDDDDFDRRISRAEHDRRKSIEKARRDREKAVRKAQKNRAKAVERARRDAEREARRRTGRGNGRVG